MDASDVVMVVSATLLVAWGVAVAIAAAKDGLRAMAREEAEDVAYARFVQHLEINHKRSSCPGSKCCCKGRAKG